jgi:hypothetical protein
MGLYHRRLVHFHYVKNTKYNKLHHAVMSDLVSKFLFRLFYQTGAPMEGETHALKTTLIEVTEQWEMLMGEGVPCPVAFEPEDLLKTKELSDKLKLADENFEGCRAMVGFETDTWVPNENYAKASALAKRLKQMLLAAITDKKMRAEVEANWFLNDMDEEQYM